MMKTLLIVFAVLLFLLTLLSSFGGSIRPAEPFYDPIPAMNELPPPANSSYAVPNPSRYDTFVDYQQHEEERFAEQERREQQAVAPSIAEMLPRHQSTVEKVSVPEPFVDMDANAGAPY
jgi:hypothetical protein